jgi:hypothetical protein
MAARFMSEVCLRMYYGEFISLFAVRLGKIGHTMRAIRPGLVPTNNATSLAKLPGARARGRCGRLRTVMSFLQKAIPDASSFFVE